MRINEKCITCLLDRQTARAMSNGKDEALQKQYIAAVKDYLENRKESDCSPFLVSKFNKLYEELFGEKISYTEVKKEYNDLVLSMEKEIEGKILAVKDPKEALAKAVLFGRIGNYIDFGVMMKVEKEKFLSLFDEPRLSEKDWETFEKFYEECCKAKSFLLLTDNCGEIVLDKLFLRALKRCFPDLRIKVMVRGDEILNDATMDDAHYVGIDQEAEVLPNGTSIAGTIYDMITDEAKKVFDEADVVYAKGQGNYESMSGIARRVYFSFLCKCQLFTSHFQVEPLTGMFIREEKGVCV